MEYKFTFMVYDLTQEVADALREQLQAVILDVVEQAGLFSGPVEDEAVSEVDDEQAEAN